jgi:hypothetical protein
MRLHRPPEKQRVRAVRPLPAEAGSGRPLTPGTFHNVRTPPSKTRGAPMQCSGFRRCPEHPLSTDIYRSHQAAGKSFNDAPLPKSPEPDNPGVLGTAFSPEDTEAGRPWGDRGESPQGAPTASLRSRCRAGLLSAPRRSGFWGISGGANREALWEMRTFCESQQLPYLKRRRNP